MYTSNSINIHNKCLGILELIKTVNNRIEDKRSKLHLMDMSDVWHPVNLMNNRADIVFQIAYYHEVKTRLIMYYGNTMEKLIAPAIEASNTITVNINRVNLLKQAMR